MTLVTRFGRNGSFVRAQYNEFLAVDEIRAKVPAIFATTKHNSRSDKFSYIPTYQLLEKMNDSGFLPVEARQGGSKDEEKRGFTKHLIRFRRVNETPVVGDTFPEIGVANAHDGTGAWVLYACLFRWTCTNGAYVTFGEMGHIRVPHRGDVSNVIDATYKVVEEFPAQIALVEQMATLQLTGPEQTLFAEVARELRYDDTHHVSTGDILRVRRDADASNSLWHTFNRVQENLTSGGLPVQTRDAQNRLQTRRSRPVNNIGDNVRLNQALWKVTAHFAQEKQSAV